MKETADTAKHKLSASLPSIVSSAILPIRHFNHCKTIAVVKRRMVEFKEKFIAFIDILGWEKLVADAESGSGTQLSKLLHLLELLGTGSERERFEKEGPTWCPVATRLERNLDFRVSQVSDSVIVSSEVSPAGAINLIAHCWLSVIRLLHEGIMCRGYIKRGRIYHTEKHFMGTGYQSTYAAESSVGAFKREANERGTPFVEIDRDFDLYVSQCSDACVKQMYSRLVKSDGVSVALFPFKRLSHSFTIGGMGSQFDPEGERKSIQILRQTLIELKRRVESFVDRENPSAVQKAAHYIGALDDQLNECDETDRMIEMLCSPGIAVERKL